MSSKITGVDVKLKTDNAAFDDDLEAEVVRILRDLAQRIEDEGLSSKSVLDINGNLIGLLAVREQK
jgi:hypothetical protein